MKRAIIVHRWEGSSSDDWRPWLKIKLENIGFNVLVPDMPDADVPVIEKWVNKLADVVKKPDSETYFIGHSIGCQAILRYLEITDTPVGGALFVAGWFNLENVEDENTMLVAKPWIETPIDFEKIKNALPKAILLISNDDPYGAFSENVVKFNVFVNEICVSDHAGHFTGSEEFSILEQFERLIKKT